MYVHVKEKNLCNWTTTGGGGGYLCPVKRTNYHAYHNDMFNSFVCLTQVHIVTALAVTHCRVLSNLNNSYLTSWLINISLKLVIILNNVALFYRTLNPT